MCFFVPHLIFNVFYDISSSRKRKFVVDFCNVNVEKIRFSQKALFG